MSGVGSDSTLAGAGAAMLAAFLWSTYYIFIHYLGAYSPLILFSIPSIIGGLLFLFLAAVTGRRLIAVRHRHFILPSAGYFASQMVIIISALLNGGVITAVFILIGDALLSPLLVFMLGWNRAVPKKSIFVPGVVILMLSASLLSLYGHLVKVQSFTGMTALVFTPVFTSLYFIYTDRSIMQEGVSAVLAPAFLIPGLLSLPFLAFYGRIPVISPRDIFLFLSIGATSMFAGYLLFFEASRISTFVLSSVLMSMIPVFTLLLSVSLISGRISTIAFPLTAAAVLGAVLCTLSYTHAEVASTESAGGVL